MNKTYSPAKYQDMYLDWVNNFLTVERFAEYYGITTSYAEYVIDLGRKHNELAALRIKTAHLYNTNGTLKGVKL